MKRFFLSVMVSVCTVAVAMADGVVVEDVIIPQGGHVALAIGYSINSGASYTGAQFDMLLPDGVTTLKDGVGKPVVTAGGGLADHTISPNYIDSSIDRFVVVSLSKLPFNGVDGDFFTVTLQADASLDVGDTFTATISDVVFTTTDVQNVPLEGLSFSVTIGEPADTRVVLDELSTVMPEAADGVDVRVKRTFKTGTWSTFCLPFAMTGEQTAEAFGSDVQIADFAGYELTEDDDDNITGITVLFDAVDATQGIEANHPYIIKTSTDINEFTLDGVDITPEDEPVVATVKRTRKQWSELIGTYVAETVVPEKTLFLNANKFWYSVGSTKMKGYRAYFDFYDVLTEVDEAYSNVRFVIGDASGIHEIDGSGLFVEDIEGYYTIDGRKLNGKPTEKGVYIANGKKILKR